MKNLQKVWSLVLYISHVILECIFEINLFYMHIYLCGKNLEINVWLLYINLQACHEWLVNSLVDFDTYIDLCLYIFPHLYWNVWCPKSQRLTLNIEISKISSTNLKMRCIVQKWSNVMNCNEAKWKASKIFNHFCRRSYMLISIIEIDHLT